MLRKIRPDSGRESWGYNKKTGVEEERRKQFILTRKAHVSDIFIAIIASPYR